MLYKEEVFRTSGGRRRGGRFRIRPTDLSDVVDPRELGSGGGACSRVARVGRISDAAFDDLPETIVLSDHPGCHVIPNALTLDQQRRWLREAVAVLPEPPAVTNHAARLGTFSGLWRAAVRGEWLAPSESSVDDAGPSGVTSGVETDGDAVCVDDENARARRVEKTETGETPRREKKARAHSRWVRHDPPPKRGNPAHSLAAAHLLEKLRWVTLGPPYDWTARTYRVDAPARSVPPDLQTICRRLAAAAGVPSFGAKVGLVNYYREGDTLAGHVDDAERDLTKPIVSISLGCPAVFLLGGETRDTVPTPVLLRSGDAVVLSGASRRWFHGLPRVFTAKEGVVDGQGRALGPPPEIADPETWTDEPDVARYVAGGRVNISVRDFD